jgi:hypothetical protein
MSSTSREVQGARRRLPAGGAEASAATSPRARARAGARALAAVAIGAAGLGLSACSGYSGSHAHRVEQWVSGSDLVANDATIRADVQDIARGIRAHKLLATHTACDGLGADAGTAYGELPTPDETLTSELNDAYLDFTRAAQYCSEARSFARGGFDRYESELRRATSALDAAGRRLEALGVSGG